MITRRAKLIITYEGTDITADIADDLLSFTHNDNASQTADDISITLKDETGKWISDWFPGKGDKIKAAIVTQNWGSDGESKQLDLGTFIVDEPTYSLSPSQLSINATSIPSNANFTDSPVSKAWNKITLQNLTGQIAKKHGLTLMFDSSMDPKIERVDQNEQSDMTFLSEQIKKYGLAYKISSETIIIYSPAEYEQKSPIMTIKRDSGVVISGSLKAEPVYTGVKVVYTPPKTGKKISVTLGTEEKLYTLNKSAASQAEAELMAKGQLRELNQRGYTADLVTVGTTDIVAGVVIALEGFGKFDGKYFVDKVSQSLPNFTVSISAHKVLEGGY